MAHLGGQSGILRASRLPDAEFTSSDLHRRAHLPYSEVLKNGEATPPPVPVSTRDETNSWLWTPESGVSCFIVHGLLRICYVLRADTA